MKKYLFFVLILTVLIASLACFTSAETESGHTWLVTHADGTTEYIDGFYTPFSTAKNGDYFKLLPKYIEVYGITDYKLDASITLDFGDSVIVHPDNTITTQMIAVSSGSVSFVGDGAKVFLQNNVRSYIQANSNVRIIGGEKGFTVHAPCAVNCGGSANVEIRNAYFFKNTGNMRSLVGARTESVVNIYNSVLHTVDARHSVLVSNKAKLNVYDSALINSNGGNAGIDMDDTAVMYVYGNSYLFCNTDSGTKKGSLFIGSGVCTSFDPTEYLIDGNVSSTVNESRSFDLRGFEAPDQETKVPFTIDSYYYTSPKALDSEKSDSSVFMVKDSSGNIKGYSTDYNYALTSAKSGYILTLLRSITVYDTTPFTVNGAITLDFNGKNIEYRAPMCSADEITPIKLSGNGTLIAKLSGGSISCYRKTLFESDGVKLDISGGSVECVNLVDSEGAVILKNSSVTLHGNAGAVCEELTLDGVSICHDADGVAVYAASASVKDSVLYSAKGTAIAGESASVLGASAVCGGIVVTRFTASLGTLLTDDVKLFDETTALISEGAEASVTAVSIKDGRVSTKLITVETFYIVGESAPFSETVNSYSVWKISRGDEVLGYSRTFDYPFLNYNSGVTLTLLRSVTVTDGVYCELAGDISINLAKSSLTYSPAGGARSRALLMVRGEGNLKITSESGGRMVCQGADLIDSDGIDLELSLAKGYLFAKRAVVCKNADLTLSDGFFSAVSPSTLFTVDGDMLIDGATVYSELATPILSVSGALELKDGVLVSETSEVGRAGQLLLSSSSVIIGNIECPSVIAQNGAISSIDLSQAGDFFSLAGKNEVDVAVYSPRGSGISAVKKVYKPAYNLYNSALTPSASFVLNGAVEMRLYIDSALTESDAFSAVISVGGLTYEVPDSKITTYTDEEGTAYSCISFPYVFAYDVDKESYASFTVSGKTVHYSFTVRELLQSSVSSLNEQDERRIAVAYYLAYVDALTDKESEAEYPSLSAELISDRRLKKTLRAVSFDPMRNRLTLTLAKGMENATLDIYYGGKSYSYSAVDGKIVIPVNRLNQNYDMLLTIGESNITFDLSDLYLFVRDSDSSSLELFAKYVDYLLAL